LRSFGLVLSFNAVTLGANVSLSRHRTIVPALLILCSLSLGAFAATTAKPAVPAPGIVAEVDGEKITTEQLEKSIAVEVSGLQEQIYRLKKQRLDTMIDDRLLASEAARQKVSVTELVDKEVTAKISLVAEQDIDAFYQANRERIKGVDNPQIRQQIRQYLQNQRLAAERDKYLQSLRAKAAIAVNLPAPPPVRVEVSALGTLPFRGPANAPVTIVKFEDFQCPFCRQVQSTFTQLESRYGDKIRVVHRDFPIDQLHPQARRAAEGARCANEQGKFWAYHDRVYAAVLSADPNQLSALAKDVGLDVDAFDRCLAGGQFKAAVQADLAEGTKLGVSSTPAFFVNGRLIVGAQPLDAFTRVIDEELATTTSAVTK
jgi:protein-disulfide isomerase